jgi:adenylate cyclase
MTAKAFLMSLHNFLTRPAFRGVWVGLACALVAWLLSQTALLTGVENWLLDGCFFYRGSRPTQANIVIIGLDEPSFDRLNKPSVYVSPELAEVVSYVKSQRAAAIGIDLFIPEKLSTLQGLEEAGSLGEARRLGRAIAEAGNVVLPQWRVKDGWRRPVLQWQLKSLLNPEPLDLAFVNLTEDDDQFVRRQQLLVPDVAGAIPHFALALFARTKGVEVAWDEACGQLQIGDDPIPLDNEQLMRINFVGPPETFAPVPFHEVLEAARQHRELPQLRGATVLIGLTDRTQQDYHATPFANNYARYVSTFSPGLMAGTEIHAHILATLQDHAFITTPWWLQSFPWVVIFGIVLGKAFSLLRLEWGLLIAVIHHFAWKGLALLAFIGFHWRVEMVGMLLLGFLVYAATFGLRWRQLRRTMGVVKSEAITLALEADPRRLSSQGEKVEVTVLFADVRNFTDFAERHEAPEVVALLKEYFTAIVPLIEAERGTIDKFMGDGLMVLFNAPAACPKHALHAVRSAVAMVRRVHERKEIWSKLDRARVWTQQGGMRIGVGIHTGTVVVGAIGSPRRLDYTAIGDTVNTAARIEAENKVQDTEILISATTYQALSDDQRRALGCVSVPRESHVKGKKEMLYLYPVEVRPETADQPILASKGGSS